jgi:dsDNA-binding SOS-regulon protein
LPAAVVAAAAAAVVVKEQSKQLELGLFLAEKQDIPPAPKCNKHQKACHKDRNINPENH